MEPAGAGRHRRSPEGEFAGASESIEPARRKKASLSNETERNMRRGRESNPRIAVLQTATLPLGYPADLQERTISLSLRLYQLAKVFGVKRRA
jgi:hypothetical protein